MPTIARRARLAHCGDVSDAFRQGAEAWPDIRLDGDDFARYLATRNLHENAPNGADLYLACACLAHDPAALRAFDKHYVSQLGRHVAQLRLAPEQLDELAQHLREKLLMGARPRLAEYSGKGKLSVWLRVVSVRAAIDLLRARAERPDNDALDKLPAAGTSPEMQALRQHYRPRFKQALADALAAIPDAQRRLLRLHFVDGMTMEAIARQLHVNRSTVMRRLDACTDALWAGLRERLGNEMGVDSGELNSLGGLLRSDLELSLGEFLKSRS
jgi:RNA polymerase sigma-70 factor (ECF subfamily)